MPEKYLRQHSRKATIIQTSLFKELINTVQVAPISESVNGQPMMVRSRRRCFLSVRSNVNRQPSGPPLGSFAGKKWDRRYKGESALSCVGGYKMETIVIVLLVLFLLGGGGWGYSRWRR